RRHTRFDCDWSSDVCSSDLKGPRAALRMKTRLPEFQFEMDQAFDDPVYLYRFDVHSDRREIRVAKGSGGLAVMSIPEDHLIETRSEERRVGKGWKWRMASDE